MPNNPACSTPARRFSLAFTASIVIAILSAAHINSGGAAQTEGGTIIGVVQDDHSMPVAGVRVTISSADFSSWVLTQTDGKFEFKNLKPAQYRITAEATGFRKERISLPITRPEDVSNPIIIRLTPSSLHVAVFDANNQPLGGVKVTLYTQDRAVARAKTDEGGDAYFGSLTPGSYQLTADLPGYDEGRDDLVPISPGMTTEVPLKLFVAPVIPINDKAVVRKRMPDLPSKNVRSIFEDSHGWIWLGTDKGVARFNGSDFKSSATNGSSYEPLAGEDVRSIAEDPSGTIWLATARGARRITKGGGGYWQSARRLRRAPPLG